jgi:hypothetical protein
MHAMNIICKYVNFTLGLTGFIKLILKDLNDNLKYNVLLTIKKITYSYSFMNNCIIELH